MIQVEPEYPWEIPQTSVVLVSSALAWGRPASLAASAPRRNGLPDADVSARYAALRTALLDAADGHTGAPDRLDQLERTGPDTSPTRWETLLMTTGAADDALVIARAHGVWEALGPNEYKRRLTSRPRTTRGFLEGRAWLSLGALAPLWLLAMALGVDQHLGIPWWVWIPAIVGWPFAVALLFRRRIRRLDQIGGAELPHW